MPLGGGLDARAVLGQRAPPRRRRGDGARRRSRSRSRREEAAEDGLRDARDAVRPRGLDRAAFRTEMTVDEEVRLLRDALVDRGAEALDLGGARTELSGLPRA